MERYTVKRIDEPDFGCEGRPEDAVIMDKVHLCDEQGNAKVVEVSDALLYERNLNEGDSVIWDYEKGLIKDAKKIAVIFPGIGYHCDKPLLYYSKMIAKSKDFDILEVSYGNFPKGVKGNAEKMTEAFFSAMEQAEELLKDVEWTKYDQILFVSKSIGTAVAAAYARKYELETRNVFLTPVEQSFQFIQQEGIVFHGTADPWAATSMVEQECNRMGLPLYKIVAANHSLETNDPIENIENLHMVMDIINKYICL